MPKARVTFSDGRTATLEGTKEEVEAAIQQIESGISSQGGGPPQAEPQPPRQGPERQDATTRFSLRDLPEEALALVEVGGTLASGAVGEILGGLGGLAELWSSGDAKKATDTIRKVSDIMTFQPRSRRGRETLEGLGSAFGWLEQGVDDLAYAASMGNPAAGAAIKTAILGAPSVFGAGKGLKSVRNRSQAVKAAEAKAEQLGVDLNPLNIRETATAAVRSSVVERGSSLPEVRAGVARARRSSQQEVTKAYERAAEVPMYVRTRATNQLAKDVTKDLLEDGFDVDAMPAVAKNLELLGQLERRIPGDPRKVPYGKNVRSKRASLKSLEVLRKRLNRAHQQGAKPGTLEYQQNTALGRMRHHIDEFIDNEFRKDAIELGADMDPAKAAAATNRWKEARGRAKRHAERFSNNDILKLIKEDASVEQMRRYIFGSSAMGARPQAVNAVKSLNQILGKDSPEMSALRMDLLHDVAEPLLRKGEPTIQHWNTFVSNYDRMVARQPQLIKELGLDMDQLQILRQVGHAIKTVKPGTIAKINVPQALSQFFFGHEIAKKALKVRVYRRGIEALFNVGEIPKRQMISDITGIDVAAPLFNKRGPLVSGMIVNDFIQGGQDRDHATKR